MIFLCSSNIIIFIFRPRESWPYIAMAKMLPNEENIYSTHFGSLVLWIFELSPELF